MNDQVTPPVVEERRRSIAPWLILALVVILAAVAVWFLTSKRVPEGDPAGFLPMDCMTASTFDFTESPDKNAALDVVKGVFKDAGIDDMEAWLFKQASKAADVDVQKDIMSKLNGKGGMATLPGTVGMMKPEMVWAVGAKSQNDAAALTKLWSDIQKKKGRNLVGADYKGVNYQKYAEDFSTICFGAIKDVVVVGNSESAFKAVCDTVAGRKPSLLGKSSYMSLREITPSTIGTSYMSGSNYYKGMIQPLLAMGGGQIPEELTKALENFFNGIEAVGMTDANKDGLTSRSKFKMPEGYSSADVGLDELASIAPKNVAFVLSTYGVNKGIADIKQHFLSGKTMKPYVDQAVQGIKMTAGFDLFTDALDRITGLAVYFVPRTTTKKDMMPGHVVIVLTVDNPSVIQTTINKIKALASMSGGVSLPEIKVAGQTVTMIPAGPGAPKMGFTLVGKTVLFGLTQMDFKDAMTGAIKLAQNKAPSLASSDSFKMVKKRLPARSSSLLYADSGSIAELIKPELDAQGKKVADAISKTVGPIALTSGGSGTERTAYAVMPFKK